MGTAAEHKIIIEQGADFTLSAQVFASVGNALDITHYTGDFILNYYDVTTSNIVNVPVTYTYTATNAVNGDFTITIDKDVTKTIPTRTEGFKTSYEYSYSVTLHSDAAHGGDDLRILRGKCAVRAS